LKPRPASGRRAHRLTVPPRPWGRRSARGGEEPAAIAARKVEGPPPHREGGDPPPAHREGGGGSAATRRGGRPGQGRAERGGVAPHGADPAGGRALCSVTRARFWERRRVGGRRGRVWLKSM